MTVTIDGRTQVQDPDTERAVLQLVQSLRSLQQSTDNANRTMIRLTRWLTGLTVTIMLLTGVLVWDAFSRKSPMERQLTTTGYQLSPRSRP